VESEGREQTLPPTEALQQWEPAAPDDFRALVAYEPDRLRALAQEDPPRLVRMVVELHKGRADFKQLKQALIPDVIPADRWSQWWGSVRVVIRRSPLLDVTGAGQPQFALRDAEGGFAEKFRNELRAAADPFEKAAKVLNYLAEVDKGHEGDAALAADLGAEFLRLARETRDPAAAMAAAAAAGEIRARFPDAPDPGDALAQAVAATPEAPRVIASIKEDIARVVLKGVRSSCAEHWPQVYADAFPFGSLRLCDAIARELIQAGHGPLLVRAAEASAAAPERHAEAFAWVWRRRLSGRDEAFEKLDPLTITVTLLDLMTRLARTPRHAENRDEARHGLARLRNVVGAGDFGLLRELIARTNTADAHRLHRVILSSDGLPEHAQHELLGALREAHPDEFIEKKNLWEDDYIYVTAEGLARRNAELEKLVNEDMRKNAKAIGDAAAKGDLRENWEYKSALEERDRLVERASRVREDLDRARVIDPSAIADGTVNVGVKLLLRDPAGKERSIAFLGPWDADIANGVYSYLAPLSRKFMGKKVGDRVSASLGDDEEAEFEIVAVEKIV